MSRRKKKQVDQRLTFDQRQVANLFPMLDGKPNPGFVARRAIPIPKQVSENSKLRGRGLLPCKWTTTAHVLRAHGIVVEDHPEAYTAKADTPGMLSMSVLWAASWAVLVAEAEPCNEDAKAQVLRLAASNTEFRDALDTIARLSDEDARRKMADFVMELWNPEGEET